MSIELTPFEQEIKNLVKENIKTKPPFKTSEEKKQLVSEVKKLLDAIADLKENNPNEDYGPMSLWGHVWLRAEIWLAGAEEAAERGA